MPAQSRVAVSADGVDIHYDVQGTGAIALVFVHGWSCNRGHWEGQASYFAPRYTVVSVDLAGHGASGRDRSQWTMPAFGQDIAAVVEQLGLKQVVLIGHSMGGAVIVEAARRLPNAVIGLVGVDTWRNVERIRTPAQVAELVAPFRANFVEAAGIFVRTMFVPTSDSTLVERVVAAMAASPPHIAVGVLEALWGHDRHLQAGIQEVRAPKIAINARQTDVEAAQRHEIAVLWMSGVGHFVMLEDPQTFNRLLDEAVRSIVRR